MKKIKSCLLIDDDEITNYINQQLIEEMMISEKVVAIDNAQLALDYIEENCGGDGNGKTCSDVILLDLNMPGMDGFEFLEKFTSYPFKDNFAVFVVSSSNNLRDRQKAEKYNVDGYIPKPLTKDKLLQIVEMADK